MGEEPAEKRGVCREQAAVASRLEGNGLSREEEEFWGRQHVVIDPPKSSALWSLGVGL